jgi:quinol monooxygenase YgiN
MAEEVRVVAVLTAQDGKADELLAGWPELAAKVRAEDGCLGYDLHRALGGSNTFVVLERWASTAALQTHGGSPHMKEFGKRAAGLLAGGSQIHVLGDDPVA